MNTAPASQPSGASRPAATQPAPVEPVTFVLGGPQEDNDPVKWKPYGSDVAVASLFRDVDVVVTFPDGRRCPLRAFNFFAHASAGRVWHAEVRPAWPLTTQRDLAKRLRAQLEEWKIPPDENQKAFLAEMDRVGDEMPDGWNTLQRCNIDLTEQTCFQIRLAGSKGFRDKNEGGWFVVFEFALMQRPKMEDPRSDTPTTAPSK